MILLFLTRPSEEFLLFIPFWTVIQIISSLLGLNHSHFPLSLWKDDNLSISEVIYKVIALDRLAL